MSAQHGAALPHCSSSPGEKHWLLAASTLVFVAMLNVPRTEHVTIGGCAFSSTSARVWNSLSMAVQSSESLDIFQRRLKTELFARSYN